MKSFMLFSASILMLFAGCDAKRAQEVPPGRNPSPPAALDIAPPSPSSSPAAEGKVQVELLPSAPTVRDALHATVTGCKGDLRFFWEINGQKLESANNRPQLPVGGYRSKDVVTVKVSCGSQQIATSTQIQNSPPTVTQINTLAKVISGRPIEIRPEAVDLDGDMISFRYQWNIDGEKPLMATETILPGEYVHAGRQISVTVTPSDLSGDGEPYTSQPVEIANAPPAFTSTPPVSFQAFEYRYQASAQDPDGDPLSYSLEKGPAGMRVESGTGEIVWPIKTGTAGVFEVTVVAQDSSGLTARQTFSIQLHRQETTR